MERFQRTKELFLEASEIPSPLRSAFLMESCADDPSLRAEVEALFRSAAETDDLLGSVVAASAGVFDASSLPSPSRIGPYIVVREIAHGGMGTVYLAVRSEERFEKRVALKIISRGRDTDFVVRRFLEERQILASLEHPNIARLYDGGATLDGLPWFAMEYIEGAHLEEHCDRNGLSVRKRVELFRQICAGVQYAHQNLVVHRDIKPGNILVTADGTAKLLDFGLARLLLPETSPATIEVTATALRMFTPEYASPEQVRGERITTASDIYSLGVVLYHLLTGKTPYRLETRSPESIAQAVVDQEAEPTVRTLGSDLDNILRMALRKDPHRRYVSAEQLSEDLRRYVEELPIAARPDTLAYRTAKFVARNRLGVVAAALVAVSIVAGSGVALWQARRARQEEAVAQRRFNEVRTLAHAVMFDLHDGIATLPGSTKIREKLVKTALEYLERLSREIGGDRSLQREIAEGYTRVGQVQGSFGHANIGDTAGSLLSFGKALTIREALASSDPADLTDAIELVTTRARFAGALHQSGREVDALAQMRRATKDGEELSRAHPDDHEVRSGLAFAYDSFGVSLSDSGRLVEAFGVQQKSLRLREELAASSPRNVRFRLNLGICLKSLGLTLLRNRNAPAALEAFEKASRIDQSLFAADPTNVEKIRNLSTSERYIGLALAYLTRDEPALGRLSKALELRERMSAADPADASAKLTVVISLMDVGVLLGRHEKRAEGLRLLHRARDLAADVERADPTRLQSQRTLAIAEKQLRLLQDGRRSDYFDDP